MAETPGKLIANGNGVFLRITSGGFGENVAVCHGSFREDFAILFAAAPDLLAALDAIVNSDMAMREEDEGRESKELKLARAAIAKASPAAEWKTP